MTPPSLLESVLAALQEVIPGTPDLTARTELLDSGLLDSLGIVSVVAVLEERHGAQFPPELLVPESFADAAALTAALAAVLADSPAALPDPATGRTTTR
ncbi:phosphopantetheine-binding protein [Streptomyces sp. MBT62]|uniref:phosphopantetheine-binding protein n=1 Tax=Streptomyces sp. MBT62 TaxID=2800410 RepID=UPI00190A2E12|nr:phosphopantetheine-binding protein [Streptomyces sp. MBT62]MBK3569775.1 hypothetical protein [Streptomyces sp. MBT62]